MCAPAVLQERRGPTVRVDAADILLSSVNDRALLRKAWLDQSRVQDSSAFPFAMPAVQALTEPLQLHPAVTFLVGENGSGKSTIIEEPAAKCVSGWFRFGFMGLIV